MTGFDIVCGVLLLWALWRGWYAGILVQLAGILGLVGGVYLAFRYSDVAAHWLSIEGMVGQATGFMLIFVPVLVGVTLLGQLLRGLFKFAGLGMFDQVGGAVLGVVKVALIVSVLLTAYESLNRTKHWTEKSTPERSLLYRPIQDAGEIVFPYLDFVRERLL